MDARPPQPGGDQRNAIVAVWMVGALALVAMALIVVLAMRHADGLSSAVGRTAKQATGAAVREMASPIVHRESVKAARNPTPNGSPADWFSEDYYPPAAKAAGVEGRVRVSLDVDAHGAPQGCVVVESSGNQDLDTTTCQLATRFARFDPARDANGAPVAGTFAMPPVRWQLSAN